jgi:predicted dehydrogenase
MGKKVVLEGYLGDWSRKSYFTYLAEKAKKDGGKSEIELYAVDIRDITSDDNMNMYNSKEYSLHFVNKQAPSEYDAIKNVDYVFIVAPHVVHCTIAQHWLEKGRLSRDGELFIEKPLDSSVDNIRDLEEYSMRTSAELDRIILVDHYILKVSSFIEELKKKKEEYGEIKKMRFHILEPTPVAESRKETLKEGLILDLFPHVLAVYTAIMRVYCEGFTLDADHVELIKVETGRYKGAPIKTETFAEVLVKIDDIVVESYTGKGIGSESKKMIEILFEKGSVRYSFPSKDVISQLLTAILTGTYDKAAGLTFYEGFTIVKIISKIREHAGAPRAYEKSDSLDEILMNPPIPERGGHDAT